MGSTQVSLLARLGLPGPRPNRAFFHESTHAPTTCHHHMQVSCSLAFLNTRWTRRSRVPRGRAAQPQAHHISAPLTPLFQPEHFQPPPANVRWT